MINKKIKANKDFFTRELSKIFLPVIIRQIVSCTPKHRRTGMMMALMPVMSLYANRLRLKYVMDSGKLTAPTLQCYVYGPSGVGKGKVDEFQTFLTEKITLLDQKERAVEEEFLKKKRESPKKTATQPDTVVMIFPEKSTSFMLVQRGLAAMRRFNGETLLTYQFSAELKSIMSAHKADYIDIDSLLCKAYDLGALTGAETGNMDASRGMVDINMNILYCATEGILYKFFAGDSLTSGTLNRAVLIPFNGKRGEYQELSNEDKSLINSYLDIMLDNIFDKDGTLKPTFLLDTSFLDTHIKKFLDKIEIITDDPFTKAAETIYEFSSRASVSAFRIAVLCLYLYRLEQQHNTGANLSDDMVEQYVCCIYNFAVYYILHNTLDRFGRKHSDVLLNNKAIQAFENEYSNTGIYDLLDYEFTYQDLVDLIITKKQTTDPKNRISKWKSSNMIIETSLGHYEKCVEYLQDDQL